MFMMKALLNNHSNLEKILRIILIKLIFMKLINSVDSIYQPMITMKVIYQIIISNKLIFKIAKNLLNWKIKIK